MKAILAATAISFALAACGDVSPTPKGKEIRMENKGSDRLKQLSTMNQRIALNRAIRASGKRCGRIDRLGYQQEYQELAMWVALCADGKHWAVFIAPNDDIQVRDCAQHAQLGLPVCRPLPPLPPEPSAPANNSTANAL
jgi:hypothetical protein